MVVSKTVIRKDGQKTRQKILTQAEKLFATQGYGKTMAKDIAQKAGVDLASINYHFGSKDGLYQAVLADAHHHIIDMDELKDIASQPIDAEEKFKLLITMLCRLSFDEKGQYAQLLAREVLSPTSHLSVLFSEEVAPKVEIIKDIIRDVANLPKDSPLLLPAVVNIMAPCLMLLVSKNLITSPIHPLHNISTSQLANYLYTFTLAGLNSVKSMSIKNH
ncbi:MAG: TetR/AcrR family transcriptional regulator [Alphaproteobacteria bacterium]